jgi:hypothetical protein
MMPRDGAIIFRDIVGKLAVLRIHLLISAYALATTGLTG